MGVKLHVKVGQIVREGQLWVELKHECQEVPKELWNKLNDAIKISPHQEDFQQSRILEIIE